MIDYASHLSRAGRALRESAIRRSGDLGLANPDLVSLAPGFPDPSLFPWDEMRAIAQELLTGSDTAVLQYGHTRGYRPLIEALPALLERRGIRATPPELMITTGSQQALDLCARVFLEPGAVALVELPAYAGALTAFGNIEARLAGVRQDADGIDLDDLDAVAERERAGGRRLAFVYVIPNFQNPTGLLMSRDRRLRLLDWAARRQVLIVEDDPYGALYFEDAATPEETRPIKADDTGGLVVYLSSFSKTVAPGLRVAWIAAPAPLAAKLEIAKQSADLCTGGLDQRLVYEVWRRGVLDRRLPLLRESYRRKRAAMERALRQELRDLVAWPAPKGGFFLWASFARGIDTEALLARALARGVMFVPGRAFFVDGGGTSQARLAFSAPSVAQIELGVQRLATAVKEILEDRESAPGPPSGPAAAQEAPPGARTSG
jgi:2-aminoadipate transaminase